MVDEQIAKAWGRLNGKSVRQLLPDEIDPYPAWVWFDGCVPYEIPDPATSPWAWVKALCARDYMSIIGMETAPTDTKSATYHVELFDDDGQTLVEIGDTPEAALEAAIRAWGATT